MKEGTKTTSPVKRTEADKAFAALGNEKTKKGYRVVHTEGGASPPPKRVFAQNDEAHEQAHRWIDAGRNPFLSDKQFLLQLVTSPFEDTREFARNLLRSSALPDDAAKSLIAQIIAAIFGLLCSEPEVEKVTLDGKNYFVAISERHLSQGAPTRPAITIILCHRLDCRLQNMADEMGFVYRRYADDLTFSTSGESKKNICNVLQKTAAIVAHEGLEIHPAKTRVLRRARQQEVTGIVVNQKLSIDRKVLKRFRAVLFQIEKDGPEGKA